MSTQSTVAPRPARRVSVPDIRARKGGEPIVSLTAYTAPMAKLLDPHCDLLLVGDSLGMVVYGMDTTLGVTLDMMINHGQAVMRGSSHALVAVDMPFGSYEESREAAYRNAARILQETGAQAVKLEGGRVMADTIGFLTARGIPVMGHVGLTPQSIQALGGFKAQGRSRADWAGIEGDLQAVCAAGAFCVVVEGVAEPLADRLTELATVPTIGIGASSRCDGQILVTEDMLGMTDRAPKFVRRFAGLGAAIGAAAQTYAADVRARRFPAAEHTYQMRSEG